MRILAIETSCDETGAAVVVSRSEIPLRGKKSDSEQSIRVLSNITATSSMLHAKTGGIIPETASREQVKAIMPVVTRALNESKDNALESWESARKILIEDIDAIAVTCGPGLIGSLLVGVETAKTLSYALNKPIVPIHHLLAHIFANFISQEPTAKSQQPEFPFIGLIVSGGHTDLLFFESVSKFKWLGGTRDDAAGEVLDKVGRILGLPYPAGPEIERRALDFQPKAKSQQPTARFHSPLINSEDFDFSFSGLKTEISRFITDKHLTEGLINEICYALQDAIFNVLINKTIRAAKLYNTGQIMLGGGVSANTTLKNRFKLQAENIKILTPEKPFTTDNAAMIGAYALLNYKPVNWNKITAQPELYFD